MATSLNAPASNGDVEHAGQGTLEDDAYTSNAPAGGTYRSVEHAGQCTLEINAHGFPDTNKSTMIPPKFVTKYPEPIDESTGEIVKTTRALTKKEENRFTGMTRNATGEEAEYKVFQVFERLIQMENDPPLLIMHSYILKNFKANVLALELGINFDGIHTVAEFDSVVLVKDTGVILVEVKRQFTEDQQLKAEEQVQNGKLFFQRIMSHIAGSACQFPVVKVIMFPHEDSPSPTLKSDRATHIVHKDVMLNFNKKWNDLMSELNTLKPDTSFSADDFQRFTWIITGTWCMEKYQRRFYKFDNNEASSSYVLQQNDEMISRGIYTSDVRTAKNESKILGPVTDVEHCRPQDGFPTCSGMNLIYLTPKQKDLYQNLPQAIVRGSAGSGKTLLACLKIVDILQNCSNKNILIIAPDPHHLRLEQFVKSNGGQTTVTGTFPPPASGGVVIITLKNFFEVSPETLQSYDVSMYHVFIDDLQSLALSSHTSSTYDDVVHLIERCYTNLIGGNQLFWCAVDVGQSELSLGIVKNEYVSYLFMVDNTTPRHLTIPIYTLKKTLRNSVEISTVVQKVREKRVAEEHASSYVLTSNTTGHRIRSEAVIYHKLTKWTSTYDETGDWEKYGGEFVVERVKDELQSILNPQKHDMKWSDIAILSDELVLQLVEPLRNMLMSTFNITPQTIKKFIMTNNNTIIFDRTENVASFECPFVLYLCGNNAPVFPFPYNTMTRARTKLVVVEYDRKQRQPFLTDDVILIEWEEKDETFYRL